MRVFRWLVVAAVAALGLPESMAGAAEANAAANGPGPPNIVWIVVEDMSAHFSCYGEKTIRTPNVDRLAAEGVKFDRAFVTGPICSISRSALITGMYQTSIGAHHHRSGRGKIKIHLPQGVTPVPRLFKDAGYHTSNLTTAEFTRPPAAVKQNPGVSIAKTDYNFEWDESMYDKTHWSVRQSGRPFFAQVQLHGGKLRGQGNTDRWPARVERVLGSRTPASAVKLPPYLPDDRVIREDWAQYLDAVRHTDWEVGQVLDRLKQAGELDNTCVFFFTDHGVSHVRNKQFLYDGGMHVPLVVRGPTFKPGTVRKDLVEHIDLGATSLALAGIPKPAAMQARDLLADNYEPRRYVFSARDRADETVERLRAVRSERHKYIRNFYAGRPYLQPNAYKDGKPIVQAIRRLHAEGKLMPEQALIMRETRPAEELYDLQNDPHELKNLAEDPAHQAVLKGLRRELDDWIAHTGDQGKVPEPEAMYDSDMAVYLGRGNPAVQRNIELMKKWAAEGK
jgi:arylsulfatase A-like enzyme